MYRQLPEFNKICIKKSRDRAYNIHLETMKKIRPSIDTRAPSVPKSMGRNGKKYEIEKTRAESIQRENYQLHDRIKSILRTENHSPARPQKPYTLQGSYQKDEMSRVTRDNQKMLKAVQTNKPYLSRNDWLYHKIDSIYQVSKNAEYVKTVPMSEILKKELKITQSTSHHYVLVDQESSDNQSSTSENKTLGIKQGMINLGSSNNQASSSPPNSSQQSGNKTQGLGIKQTMVNAGDHENK